MTKNVLRDEGRSTKAGKYRGIATTTTVPPKRLRDVKRIAVLETKLKGAFLIKPHRFEDDRGFFSRTFCENEFAEYGLNGKVVQTAISYNKKKGTFRGMHFQEAPFPLLHVILVGG